MALEFKDRIPQKPGRVKITPENGTAYYATMERADEPIEPGTPLNAGSFNQIIAMIQAVSLDTTVEEENEIEEV